MGCRGDEGDTGPVGPEGPAGPSVELDSNLSTMDKAMVGVGGEVPLQAMNRFQIVAKGGRGLVLQGTTPRDSAVEVSTFDVTVSYDMENDNIHLKYERDYGFGPVPELAYNEIIQGNVGHIDARDAILNPADMGEDMPSARMASSRRQQRLLNPHVLLKEIMADSSIASEAGFGFHDGSIHELLNIVDPVAPLAVWVNARTGLISKLTTRENDPLLRDSEIEVHYVGWKVYDEDVMFPADVFIVKNGQVLHRERRTSIEVNPTFAATMFAFPTGADPMFVDADAALGQKNHQFHQMFVALGIPLDQQQIVVTPHQFQDGGTDTGIFHLQGGTHHSLAIAQENGVIIAEAPLDAARSAAILSWVDENIGKPVTHVIATHHHIDHSAGLRAFVAAGATIVVQQNSAAFFREVFRAPSTILPDTQAMAPKNPVITAVAEGGSLDFDDTATTDRNDVEVYHIATDHSNDMLIVHVPRISAVFESDLWNPEPTAMGGGNSLSKASATQLRQGIEDNITPTPTDLIGGHGLVGRGTFADLAAFVDAP